MNWEEAHQVTSGLLLYSMYHTGAKWVTLLPELDEYFVIGTTIRFLVIPLYFLTNLTQNVTILSMNGQNTTIPIQMPQPL